MECAVVKEQEKCILQNRVVEQHHISAESIDIICVELNIEC